MQCSFDVQCSHGLTESYDKSFFTNLKISSKKQSDNTKTPQKVRLHVAISEQLRTISWDNDSHPTGVSKPVNGPNFSTSRYMQYTLLALWWKKQIIWLWFVTLQCILCIFGKVTLIWVASCDLRWDQNLGHLNINKGWCYLWCWRRRVTVREGLHTELSTCSSYCHYRHTFLTQFFFYFLVVVKPRYDHANLQVLLWKGIHTYISKKFNWVYSGSCKIVCEIGR